MLTAERTKRSRTVEATIGYVDPAAPIGEHNDAYRAQSTLKLIPAAVRIEDARPLRDELALEANGFVFLKRPTAVHDFHDPAEREKYHAEARALVAELTGAEDVLIFGGAIRDGTPNAPEGVRGPVLNAHVDYNEETIRAVVRHELPPEEAERRLAGRIVLVNLWRPITPVEDFPLAVCDARTVGRGELVHGPIGGKPLAGFTGAAGYNLAHSPAHRWYYVPDMQPDEVLVFKLCDTDASRVQWTAHTSFKDPNAPPDAAPRRSIELRTLAFMPA